MRKGRFLLAFLLCFAVLLVVWSRIDAGRWYTDAMLQVAAIIGPITHGWILEPAAEGARPKWVHGRASVDLQIQFEALAVGIVPLIALLSATPAIALAARLWRIAVGIALCFVIDVIILVLFPLLVYYQNDFTDIAGTFLGVIGFVGAPAIIWFVLTFPQLRQSLPRMRSANDSSVA
ncbi:MAG TPA: hypothetical protein VEB21_16510 [Terriglobales bacterium]|nr:hypothetical protein [Terriglobales bacterium]